MLFVGDDWAEDHHDIEVQDETGRRLGKARLEEGIAGIARLHALIGEQLGEDGDPQQVAFGIETDRGPWVQALIAAGYRVYAINPLQVARHRERRAVSGAKSDAGDAHTLADMVRTDRHQLRPVAGDSQQAEAIKVLARAHKTLIWERTRHTLRLRQTLREFFPAALAAFDDLAAADTLDLLGKAPDPASAARLTTAQMTAALKRAGRRDVSAKAEKLRAALRSQQLGQPPVVTAAYAATVRAHVAILATLRTQIKVMEEQVQAHLGSTRTLRSTSASPAWTACSAPGCLPSSATTPPDTPTPKPAATTPEPVPSLASPARRRLCSPGTCTTTDLSTPSTAKPSPP